LGGVAVAGAAAGAAGLAACVGAAAGAAPRAGLALHAEGLTAAQALGFRVLRRHAEADDDGECCNGEFHHGGAPP
jgi:hypothetical protein